MEQELFNPQSSSVNSSRIIYTPSTFARTSLLHLQEVGSLQAVCPHVSQREDLVSFLCFIVLSGKGELSYEGQTYKLSEGDCVFIDCRKAYSHSTSDNLWSLQWCHFYAPSLPAVYEKYKERGGRPVFHPDDLASFTSILTDLYDLASSADYIRDMRRSTNAKAMLETLSTACIATRTPTRSLVFPATMLSHCKVFFCFIGTASFLFFRAGHGTTAPLRAGRTNRTTDAHTAGSADP